MRWISMLQLPRLMANLMQLTLAESEDWEFNQKCLNFLIVWSDFESAKSISFPLYFADLTCFKFHSQFKSCPLKTRLRLFDRSVPRPAQAGRWNIRRNFYFLRQIQWRNFVSKKFDIFPGERPQEMNLEIHFNIVRISLGNLESWWWQVRYKIGKMEVMMMKINTVNLILFLLGRGSIHSFLRLSFICLN